MEGRVVVDATRIFTFYYDAIYVLLLTFLSCHIIAFHSLDVTYYSLFLPNQITQDCIVGEQTTPTFICPRHLRNVGEVTMRRLTTWLRNQLSFVPPQPSRKYHERPLQLNPSYIAGLHCELGGSRP